VQKHTFIGFEEVIPPPKRVKTVPPRPVPDLQTIEEKTMIHSNVAVPKSEIAQSGPKACEEVEEVVVTDFSCYTAAALPKCEVLVDACVHTVDDGRKSVKTEIAAAEAYAHLPWQEHSYGVQKHTFIGFEEVIPPPKRVKTVPPRPVPDLQTIEEKTMIHSNVAVPKSEIAQSGPKACEEVEEVVISDDETPKCWADEEETHWVTPENSHLDVVVPLVGEAHNATMAPKVAEACDVVCAIPTQPPHDADELPEGYQRTFNNKSGVCALLWRVPKKKIKDTQMASQKFGLWFGNERYMFMICGSPGGGQLQLKLQSEAPNTSICFRFLVGSQPPCVAVLNNFSENNACKCATEWDFKSAVDKDFVSVTLEVMPSVRA